MNVRKRGLALLMCICMIFTLLPFSAFADGTSEPDVVYGKYDNGTWTQVNGMTADSSAKNYKNNATGADVTYSKTAVSKGNDTYDVTLKIESTTSSVAPGASAVVLVIDISTSMYQCTECGRSWENGQNHERDCSYRVGGSSKVSFEQTRLYAARNAAVNFVNSYAGAKENAGRYLQIVSFQGYAYKNLSNWMDVSNASDRQDVISVINALEPVFKGDWANGTNLEQGLSLADECISNAPNGIASDKKFAVVLTDGEPNKQGSSSSQWNIKSKTDAAASSLKSAASVYTVCFGAESTWSDELGMNVGPYLSGTVASNPSNAFNAKSAADLNSAFENIFASIEQGLSSGFAVTDPMGEYIQLQDASLADCTINNGTITWTPTAGTTTDNADGSKTYTYTLTYTVKLDTSADGFVDNQYYPTNGITTLAFKDGDNNITRDFNVPGVKGTAPKCTVTYNKGDHGNLAGQDANGNVATSVKRGDKTPEAPAVTPDDGYEFTGWNPTVAETVTEDVTYTAQYKIKDNLSYTVHYYWNGTNESVKADHVVTDQTFNTIVTEEPANVIGYTPVSTESKTITIGTDTNANVITFYYYKNVELVANSDTVTYDGEEHSVSSFTGAPENADFSAITVGAKGIEAGTYPANFADNTVGTLDATGKYIVTKTTNGNLTIDPIGTVTVTITGNHDRKVYNGTEQSVTGYTTDVGEKAITVALKEGKTAIAKGTNVGNYKMGLTAEDFEVSSNNYSEIKVVVVDGYLDITPITDKITVEITGNSDSVVYDGTEHSVKDYTVKISDSRYTEKDFTFSGKALASGINAGTYEMGLKADQFKNTNARFKNVEFIIKADGVLTITQRPLTITAGSAEGIAPVTCDEYTVEGLATGDKVDSVKITGIQSEPGESPNVASDAVIKNAKGEDVTANYKITYVDGVLKAIEVLNKEIHFNYVIGYTDGTIRPSNNISRAEVATIFFRLLTDEARTQYDKTTSSFSDIKDGAWCCRAVSTLTNMGIIKGYTDGTFRPNADITRAELATIIARFAKLDVNTKTFSDITGHWAQKSIELAAGNGWINGYTDGTFRPNKSIIRAETFAMINRVLDRQTENVSDLLPTSDMNMWSDNMNENAWYYKDVQEATNYHKCDRVGDSVYEKWTEKVPDIDWASYQI